MEAGASPLLRGGRRYLPVPTGGGGDNQEDAPVLSTEQQKREMNKRKRVVMKGGVSNVLYKNISKKRRRYISDLVTTLLGKGNSWSSHPTYLATWRLSDRRQRRRAFYRMKMENKMCPWSKRYKMSLVFPHYRGKW